MWKNNGKAEPSSGSTNLPIGSSSTNVIASGTLIEGTMDASSDIRIDGELRGNLNCSGKVIIGASGLVDGEVNCQNALIEGKLIGKIFVKEMLQVKDSGHLEGNIKTDKLSVQPGAIFNVSCDMGGNVTSLSPKTMESEPKDFILEAKA